MALFKRGGIWWYKFYFAGQFIRESSKSSSKTVAKNAEQQRRRELETGFHNFKEVRQQRIRRLNDIVAEYLVGYRLRYRSATFAEYALGHVSRLLGAEMAVDIDEATVLRYQENRLREKAAPKSINEEVRFLEGFGVLSCLGQDLNFGALRHAGVRCIRGVVSCSDRFLYRPLGLLISTNLGQAFGIHAGITDLGGTIMEELRDRPRIDDLLFRSRDVPGQEVRYPLFTPCPGGNEEVPPP
jgi:hypothetical protein